MKRVLAFILLICHINFSMLLPQMAEQDLFNSNGQQADDINSVYEYVDQVVLANKDDTPEDEDDDKGQNFQAARTIDCVYQQQSIIIQQTLFIVLDNPSYSEYIQAKLSATSFDIITPPPQA